MTRFEPSISDLRGLLDDAVISSMSVFKSYFIRLFTNFYANSPYAIESWYFGLLEHEDVPIEDRLYMLIDSYFFFEVKEKVLLLLFEITYTNRRLDI